MYHFTVKSFNELSNDELYAILQLRQKVFIVEQNCVYHDIDGIDSECFHLFAHTIHSKNIIAYARLVPAKFKFDIPSIGRVINDKNYRGQGLGKLLMQKAIEETCTKFKTQQIKISAQTYLLNFYTSLGFKSFTTPYDEDGIEHVDMIFVQS